MIIYYVLCLFVSCSIRVFIIEHFYDDFLVHSIKYNSHAANFAFALVQNIFPFNFKNIIIYLFIYFKYLASFYITQTQNMVQILNEVEKVGSRRASLFLTTRPLIS